MCCWKYVANHNNNNNYDDDDHFPILRFSKTFNLKIFKKIKDRSSQANNNIHVNI